MFCRYICSRYFFVCIIYGREEKTHTHMRTHTNISHVTFTHEQSFFIRMDHT